MIYFLIICLLHHAIAGVHINKNMKSFSNATKADVCHANREIILYDHKTGPGILTEQWFTGTNCFNGKTIVRYYINGDKTPTIEANVFMMHGIGFYDGTLPSWGTKWIGHVARNGGLYNTYRIPFQKSIKITFISATSGYYWYIVRGMENYPVIIGDLPLPSNAKLVLHKIEKKTFQPLTYVPLLQTSSNGLVFSVTLAGESSNFVYLEGCFGTIANGTKINMLSSGTEDFFLSAYYYNKGIFHTDDSGLTYIKYPGTMSAYKFFYSDPILMEGNFSLLWRVSEKTNLGNCWTNPPPLKDERYHPDTKIKYERNPKMLPLPLPLPLATTITSYVWTYEW